MATMQSRREEKRREKVEVWELNPPTDHPGWV
jgi:hypothetical protein